MVCHWPRKAPRRDGAGPEPGEMSAYLQCCWATGAPRAGTRLILKQGSPRPSGCVEAFHSRLRGRLPRVHSRIYYLDFVSGLSIITSFVTILFVTS